MPTPDDDGVRTAIDAISKAWDANDADAFVVPYAPDATAQVPGSRLEGREAIRALMANAFDSYLKGTKVDLTVDKIRYIGRDTAVALAKGAVISAGETDAAPETATLDTWVLSRDGDRWRVEAFHNAPAQAA